MIILSSRQLRCEICRKANRSLKTLKRGTTLCFVCMNDHYVPNKKLIRSMTEPKPIDAPLGWDWSHYSYYLAPEHAKRAMEMIYENDWELPS